MAEHGRIVGRLLHFFSPKKEVWNNQNQENLDIPSMELIPSQSWSCQLAWLCG